MNFDIRNIYRHKISSFIAVLFIIVASLYFVYDEKATFAEITAFLVPIISLLLYGNSNKQSNNHTENKIE